MSAGKDGKFRFGIKELLSAILILMATGGSVIASAPAAQARTLAPSRLAAPLSAIFHLPSSIFPLARATATL
jgi:hypothetical protein